MRGSAVLEVRRERGAPGGEIPLAAVRAGDPAQRLGVRAGRPREHRHVAGERLDAGQAERLPVRRADDGVGGVHPGRHVLGGDGAERQQLGVVADELAGAVGALDGARAGRRETARSGPSGSRPSRWRAARRSIGWKRVDVDAAGQDRHVALDAGAGDLGRELGRRRADEVHPSEHGDGDRARARVVEVVAVQRDEARAAPRPRAPARRSGRSGRARRRSARP